MIGRSALLRATAANHRAWFRRGAAVVGGGTQRIEGLEIVVEGGSATIAFPRSGLRSREALDEVMRHARRLEVRRMGCWALRDDRRLGTLLLARGFECGWQPNWMALDLSRLPDDELRHPVVAVKRGTTDVAEDVPYSSARPAPPAARRLAVLAGGQAIGKVVVNPWRGFAGIYDMGVSPRHRRQGFGRALTLAACRVARELGCSHALLNATEEGEALYTSVGFESLGLGRTWWLHPGPRPTARQTAVVETVGLGRLDELTSLRLTRAELEEPMRGAGSPLAVAVVTGRPDVADWILRRRPDLVSRPLEPRGGTLLRVAVEWDDEALVRVALAHGADRLARDSVWNGTPAGPCTSTDPSWRRCWRSQLTAAKLSGVIGDILQPTHLLFVLVIALLVLGPKRLPEVGRSLGRGLRDFKDALSMDERDRHEEVPPQTTVPTSADSTPPPPEPAEHAH